MQNLHSAYSHVSLVLTTSLYDMERTQLVHLQLELLGRAMSANALQSISWR